MVLVAGHDYAASYGVALACYGTARREPRPSTHLFNATVNIG